VTPEPPFTYRPAPKAPTIAWPGGEPVAVWVAVNVEHYPIDRPGLSIVPVTAGFVPDPMNYGWRDYGARVGIFALIELLEELAMPVTAPLHSEVCERYPEIVAEGVRRGWSWMAHGKDNAALHVDLDRETERAMLVQCVQAIERATRRQPRGWLGPALTETFQTPALLAEFGIAYACDWCNDDRPYLLSSTPRPVVSVPYSIELNDVTLLLSKGWTARQYADALIDQFEQLRHAGQRSGVVMAIPLHPFLAGVPFRLAQLRRALEHIVSSGAAWLTTADEIADHYLAHHSDS
jgi:peptidoglycan/xylan/chitin deacetylase (PgdA/CDA1 family)